jgi:CBS domain-containing protein
MIGTQDLARYPREEWSKRTVGEAMRRDVDALSVRPDADALEALGRMQRTGSDRLLVTDRGHLMGVVGAEDLLSYLNLKLQLEDGDR